MAELSPNQSAFCDYLFADPKRIASEAYIRAFGCRPKVANASAAKLIKDPRVQARLTELEAARSERLGMSADAVLRELKAVVAADARELVEYRRGACRYCYGEGFFYHRTPAEYRRDVAHYLANEATKKEGERDTLGVKFDPQGGIGYNPTRPPHPKCPECFGQGVGYSYAMDTRNVSREAARLYAGVKETKDGLEIKLRSVDKSLELMMRNLGMLADKNKDLETAEEKAAAVRELCRALGATSGDPSQ